jgi:glycosyltransferase involved in cell wall biosynthesis
MTPEVTIITPVLNAVGTIARCIRSVAAQGVAVQHIVMDGGSTDGTVDIIRGHEGSLAHWASTPDRGQAHAINKGLALAEGRTFNWLNADDVLEPGAMEDVLRSMTGGTDVVIGKCLKINEEGVITSSGGTSLFPSREKTIARYGMAQPSHFYRTEAVRELGGLNENLHFAMDMDLWFRYLLSKGVGRVSTTEAVLSRFSMNGNAKSQRQAEEMKAEHTGIIRSLYGPLSLPKTLQGHLKAFPIPEGVEYVLPDGLDTRMLLAYLCEGMLPRAYADADGRLLHELLDIVSDAGLLKAKDRLLWQLRQLKTRAGR